MSQFASAEDYQEEAQLYPVFNRIKATSAYLLSWPYLRIAMTILKVDLKKFKSQNEAILIKL